MNKVFSFFLSLGLNIVLLSIFLGFYLHYFVSLTPVQNNVINSCENNITAKIEFIANKVSIANNYTNGTYICKDYAKSLVGNLTKEGISSYCVIGLYNTFSSHEWVEVVLDNRTIPIEAVDGTFIGKEDYKENYFVLERGRCV